MPTPDSPVPFGYKMCWLAVRSEDGPAIAAALGFTELEPASWQQGVEAAYDNGLFVAPPIDGWTLVAGFAVAPELEQPRGRWRNNLIELSCRFPEAQLFASHRVVEMHAWAKARAGAIERAYCYIGESLAVPYDEGAPTDAERELGFRFPGPGDVVLGEGDVADDPALPNESSVEALASRWGLSPFELSAASAPPALGFLAVSKAATVPSAVVPSRAKHDVVPPERERAAPAGDPEVRSVRRLRPLIVTAICVLLISCLFGWWCYVQLGGSL